jgi:hypothetical protein
MVLQAEMTFVIIKIDIFGYHKKPDNRFLTKRGVTELVGSIVGDSILQVILHFLSRNFKGKNGYLLMQMSVK